MANNVFWNESQVTLATTFCCLSPPSSFFHYVFVLCSYIIKERDAFASRGNFIQCTVTLLPTFFTSEQKSQLNQYITYKLILWSITIKTSFVLLKENVGLTMDLFKIVLFTWTVLITKILGTFAIKNNFHFTYYTRR